MARDKANTIRLPKDSQHIIIIGRNGTGKTHAAVWHLAKSNFDVVPRVVFDFKGDELINEIDRAEHIDLSEVPRHPGIYIVHPTPFDIDEGLVEGYFWKMYERESIGGYIDESYMVGNSPAFRTLLTQGRSKKIPLICLTQRPSWVTRFLFSEASYFQVFDLNDRRDKKTIESFVPVNLDARLPEYHSYYYEVHRDKLTPLRPVPDKETILEEIETKLGKRRRML